MNNQLRMRSVLAVGISDGAVITSPLAIIAFAFKAFLARALGVSQYGVYVYAITLINILAITDVLCLPGYREGFGTVVIEAAAMGVPTVGTRSTGLSDAVVDGVTGLLVPPHDATALEQGLRRLLENPALREFDARVVIRRMAEEYVRLLTQAGEVLPHD